MSILDNRLLTTTLGNVFLAFQEFGNRAMYRKYRRVYRLDKTFGFNGNGIKFYGEGEITGGKNSYISQYSVLEAHPGCCIDIGEKCSIGDFVRISTSNRVADQDMSKEPQKIKSGNVKIGDFCWIGTHVYIKEGVSIGKNSVIGANSVVTKDIPPYSIAAGVPCRVIRKMKSL